MRVNQDRRIRLGLTWHREFGLTLLLGLLALLAYGQLLEPGATPYSRHSDLVAQHLAMKNVAYESFQVGEGLPQWKTDMLGGGPALTHPQALFTHPLQLLFLFFEPTAAAGPTLLLHFLAMALSMQRPTSDRSERSNGNISDSFSHDSCASALICASSFSTSSALARSRSAILT